MDALKHTFITLPLADSRFLNAYLICEESERDRCRENVCHKMMEYAEDNDLAAELNIMLTTEMDSEMIEKVCRHLSELNPECAEKLATVKDYHVTIWISNMGLDEPHTLH